MKDNESLMEGIIKNALKKINAKKRREALVSKIDKKLDDMQKEKGITPGKLSASDHAALSADNKYINMAARYSSVRYGGKKVPIFGKIPASRYLTGKGKEKKK